MLDTRSNRFLVDNATTSLWFMPLTPVDNTFGKVERLFGYLNYR